MFPYHENQRSLSIIIHTKVHHNVIMIILLDKEKENKKSLIRMVVDYPLTKFHSFLKLAAAAISLRGLRDSQSFS